LINSGGFQQRNKAYQQLNYEDIPDFEKTTVL